MSAFTRMHVAGECARHRMAAVEVPMGDSDAALEAEVVQ
jgi:hypothetical protein